MSAPNEPVTGWVEVKILGSGGFGTVALWQNEATNEQLALKKCRLQSEMTPKHRQRWELEVDIMKRLSHANVIRALAVPDGVSPRHGDLAVLAMEYCSGGDLRRVLNMPQSSCGLKEAQLRQLVSDVAAGVEYLHSKRIIHRDLKPENIVLQPADDNVYQYKIIDLGYAKELDQGSVCHSFVGTLQYLAPELFNQKKYTCTVDYWSFGVVVFECITGGRPFLPTMPPVQWHQHVSRKQQEDICAYFNMKGDVVFDRKLPQPNHLCRTSRTYFEQFLRLMLTWDSIQRGGGFDEFKRARCFNLLGDILKSKLVHLLCVPTGQLLSYPINDTHSMRDLQATIEVETRIPVSEQELLLASGMSPDPTGAASQLWSGLNYDDDNSVVFLFRKHCVGGQQMPIVRKAKPLLEAVQYMITEPVAIMNYQDQKKAWSQAMYMCSESALDYRRLFLAAKAAQGSVMRQYGEFNRLRNHLTTESTKLLANVELCHESLTTDLESYRRQAEEGGITSKQLYDAWLKMGDELNIIAQLQAQVVNLSSEAQVIQARIVEVQRYPCASGKPSEGLDSIEKEATKLYEELRKVPKDERQRKTESSTPMVAIVVKCIKLREKLAEELYLYMQKLLERSAEVSAFMPKVQGCLRSIGDARQEVLHIQQQRQQDMWKLVSVMLQQSQTQAGGQLPLRQGSQKRVRVRHSNLSMSPSGGLGSMPSMSSFIDRTAMESMDAISSSNGLLKSLENLLQLEPPPAAKNSAAAEDGAVSSTGLSDLQLDWKFLAK